MLPNLSDVILNTLLGRLALLFLAATNGDLAVARDAARETLAAYDPTTPAELHLAAEIIGFSFHALEALGQATGSDISMNQKLRLRGSAVSLSREAHKAERKLDKLQKARRAGVSVQPKAESATQSRPDIEQPPIVTAPARLAAIPPNKNGIHAWTQADQRHQAAKRITENLRKNQSNIAHPIAATAMQQAALSG